MQIVKNCIYTKKIRQLETFRKFPKIYFDFFYFILNTQSLQVTYFFIDLEDFMNLSKVHKQALSNDIPKTRYYQLQEGIYNKKQNFRYGQIV